MNDTSLAALLQRQAAAAKDFQHRLILGKHIGFEPRQARLLGKKRKMPEQQARDPLSPISRSSQKGELGALRPISRLDELAPTAKLRSRRRLSAS